MGGVTSAPVGVSGTGAGPFSSQSHWFTCLYILSQEQRSGHWTSPRGSAILGSCGRSGLPCPATHTRVSSLWSGPRPPPGPLRNLFSSCYQTRLLGASNQRPKNTQRGERKHTCVLQSGHWLYSCEKNVLSTYCIPGSMVGTGVMVTHKVDGPCPQSKQSTGTDTQRVYQP